MGARVDQVIVRGSAVLALSNQNLRSFTSEGGILSWSTLLPAITGSFERFFQLDNCLYLLFSNKILSIDSDDGSIVFATNLNGNASQLLVRDGLIFCLSAPRMILNVDILNLDGD